MSDGRSWNDSCWNFSDPRAAAISVIRSLWRITIVRISTLSRWSAVAPSIYRQNGTTLYREDRLLLCSSIAIPRGSPFSACHRETLTASAVDYAICIRYFSGCCAKVYSLEMISIFKDSCAVPLSIFDTQVFLSEIRYTPCLFLYRDHLFENEGLRLYHGCLTFSFRVTHIASFASKNRRRRCSSERARAVLSNVAV